MGEISTKIIFERFLRGEASVSDVSFINDCLSVEVAHEEETRQIENILAADWEEFTSLYEPTGSQLNTAYQNFIKRVNSAAGQNGHVPIKKEKALFDSSFVLRQPNWIRYAAAALFIFFLIWGVSCFYLGYKVKHV